MACWRLYVMFLTNWLKNSRTSRTIPTSTSTLGSSRYSRISFNRTEGPMNWKTMEKTTRKMAMINLTLANLQTALVREGDSDLRHSSFHNLSSLAAFL